jgi:hypothetical protein
VTVRGWSGSSVVVWASGKDKGRTESHLRHHNAIVESDRWAHSTLDNGNGY